MLKTSTHESQPTWPIVGHEWAVDYLTRVMKMNGMNPADSDRGTRNAYLFLGPSQVGKSTLVRAFAQALLCEAVDDRDRPCGECRSCRYFRGGGHPDLRIYPPLDKDEEVDRANGSLRVMQAEEIIHEAALRPTMGRYKIFLIQDAHQARVEFSNKLLKTLEEPPLHVILCLTATDRSELLPTIVSRCEVMELRPVASATIRQALVVERHVDPEEAELLARLSGGRYGWAIRQLEDTSYGEQRLEALDQLHRLVAGTRIDRLKFSEEIAAKRNNERLFSMLELWAIWWRDVLLAQNGCADAVNNLDQLAILERYATQLTTTAVQMHLQTLKKVERYLHHTVNTRLAMDTLLLDMPRQAESSQ